MLIDYKRGHVPALDGFRGLAVMMVFVYHCVNRFPGNQSGWIGVDLFFVLSGFLITGILLDVPKTRQNYLRFMGRRALRILPLFYFSLLAVLALIAYGGLEKYSPILEYQAYFWTYTQNFLMIKMANNEGLDILRHFWSLAVEEQFYLIWPLIVFFIHPRYLLKVILAGIAMSVILRNIFPDFPFAFVFTFARFDALLIGAFFAYLIRFKKELLQGFLGASLLVSASLILLLAAQTHSLRASDIYMIRFGYTLLPYFFGALLVLVFTNELPGKLIRFIMGQKIFSIPGKYSYGIYVYHYILYHALLPSLSESLFSLGIPNRFFAHILIFTLIVFLLSVLSFHFLEKPFLKRKSSLMLT